MADIKEDTIEIVDGRLVIDVALADDPQPSASGKTMVHYSTRGNIKVDDYVLGLTLYKSRRQDR